jgi:teichuronic acid biosynthesis glycosyltransferase TuaG
MQKSVTEHQMNSTAIPGLVSVIMPAFNAEPFIEEAIQSVIHQTYHDWELIIINDGSTDRTGEIVESFNDPRIFYISKQNEGVSAARNMGLQRMRGEFVCFLDADDVLTSNSIKDRMAIFLKRPDVDFVDGSVIVTKRDLRDYRLTWTPSFEGAPHKELIRLRDTCFITISWMIRTRAIGETRFHVGLSHCEDLWFLIDIAANRLYTFTPEAILYFRRTGNSAMSNLEGLGKGYLALRNNLKQKKYCLSRFDHLVLKWKINKIMFLSFAAEGRLLKATVFVIKNSFR